VLEKPFGLKDISFERWCEFAERVRKAKGKTIVLVHPFFEQVKDEKYNSVLKKILLNSRTPVIVLVPFDKLHLFDENLDMAGIPENKRDFLVVLTEEDSSRPVLEFNPKTLKAEADKERKALFDLMEKAGVKKIFVGGMFAEHGYWPSVNVYESRWLRKKGLQKHRSRSSTVWGCAASFYRGLVEHKKFEKVRRLPRLRIDRHTMRCHSVGPYGNLTPLPKVVEKLSRRQKAHAR
jgi:hypothetical protein